MPSVVKKRKQIPRHTDVFVLHMTMETLTKGVILCLQHLQVQDPQHNLVVGGEKSINRINNKTRSKNAKKIIMAGVWRCNLPSGVYVEVKTCNHPIIDSSKQFQSQ